MIFGRMNRKRGECLTGTISSLQRRRPRASYLFIDCCIYNDLFLGLKVN